LEWFKNNSMVFLEKKYLNDGTKGLELVKSDLMLLFMEATAGAEFEEARGMSDWDTWIEQQAKEAIYNPTMTYDAMHPGEGSNGGMKSELYEKLENWKRGVIATKGTSARNLPVLLTDNWQTTLPLRAGRVSYGCLEMRRSKPWIRISSKGATEWCGGSQFMELHSSLAG
jgi:hypothetical protein